MVEMMTVNQAPNESRGFVHGRIGRAVKGFVTSGFSPVGAAAGFASRAPMRRTPARRPAVFRARQNIVPARTAVVTRAVRPPPSRSLTARSTVSSSAQKALGRSVKLQGLTRTSGLVARGPCPPLMQRDPLTGTCKFFLGQVPGIDDPVARAGVGDAVMGRYGAAYEPGSQLVDRAVCLPGDVVADDGLCYPKASVTNKQRAWPRGRRPLLTGGDMRAISTAARAGRRLEGAQKRLQKIGLMKKPAPRRQPRQITSGPTDHHHHA